MKYCKNCGQEAAEKSRYCSKCGEYLPEDTFSVKEEKIKFCPSCGSSTGKEYCPSCGAYAKKVSLGRENSIANTILKTASKVQNATKTNIKNNQTVKNNKKTQNKKSSKKGLLIPAAILLVAAVAGSVWLVNEKVIIPKQQKASTEWVHYTENRKIGFKDTEGNVKLKA